MSNTVPPVPYKSPMINAEGFLTSPWDKWFRELFLRIGQSIAPSNLELSVQLGDVPNLQSQLDDISDELSAIDDDVQRIAQGRAL